MGKGKSAGLGTAVVVVLVVLNGINEGYQQMQQLGAAPQTPQPLVQATPGSSAATDQVFAAASPAVALIEVRGKTPDAVNQGSGFFVSADGLLVTNFHVISGGADATVHCSDGRELSIAGAVAVSPEADLALLKVNTDGKSVPYLQLSTSDIPAIGARVFAIGNPRGLTNTLSDGLVSGMRELEGFDGTLIQTSAPISPGSSGGPLLAADGTVVGVTTAGFDDAQNLNFAVPAAHVRHLLTARGEARALSIVSPPQTLEIAQASADGRPSQPSAGTVATGMDEVHEDIDALLRQKKHAAAMTLLREIAVASGNSPRYWCLLGRAQEDGYNNLSIAEDAFRRAIKLKPAYKLAHERLGLLLLRRQRYTDSIDSFRTLAKLDPKSMAGYRGAGMACAQMGEHAQALTYYDWALKLAPLHHAEMQELRGQSLYQLSRDDEAAAAFNAVLKATPTSLIALHGIGELHLRRGRTAEAKRQFDDVIRLYPQYPRAHLQLGRIAHRAGDNEAARAAWQNAWRYDPAGPDGRAALEQLLRLPGGVRRLR